MHPNPVFRRVPRERTLDFVRARGFGALAIAVDGDVLAAHVPFRLDETAAWAEMHLARSNPILRHPGRATLIVTGPDAYISPDWYGTEDQVPTWNYVAAHLRGRLEVLDRVELHPHLERVSANFERTLDKPEWTTGKMTPGVLERMERMIVPIRLHLDDIQATWKLGQNKEAAVRLAAAEAVPISHGMEQSALAEMMRAPPAEKRDRT